MSIMGIINTCYNCEERTLGCHSSCKRYIEAKKLHNKEREQIRMNNEIDIYIKSKYPLKKNMEKPKALKRNKMRVQN